MTLEQEALLDAALELQEMFEAKIVNGRLVAENPKLAARAERINDDLAEMYQEIGREFA